MKKNKIEIVNDDDDDATFMFSTSNMSIFPIL